MNQSAINLRPAGDFLFSNVIWSHPTEKSVSSVMTGKGHIDAREGQLTAQTVSFYRMLAEELETRGLSLDSVVHQRVRLRSMAEYGSWFRAARDHIDLSNVATALHAEGDTLPPGIRVAFEVVICSEAGRPKEVIAPADALAASHPFPPAVRSGQFIFTSTLNPTTPEGRVVTGFDELERSADAREFAEFRGLGRQGWQDERHAAQMLAVYEHVERILGAVGGSVECLLKHHGFVRMSMDAYTSMEAARRAYFRDRPAPPATTVQVADLGIAPEVDLTFDVIALAPGEIQREVVDLSKLTTPYGFYLQAVRAGRIMFTAGELPYVKNLGGDPRGGALGTWDPDPAAAIAAQTREVVGRLARILDLAGTGTGGLRKLGVYLQDRSHLEAWSRLALAELPEADPVITETVMLDAGPYPGCLFELDSIAEYTD